MEATSVARPHGLRLPKPRRVLTSLSDERLVDRVRDGDAAAFEVLYDRHHRGILAFCRHMLRSADEAEDAVQHAFIAAYNDLQRDARDIHFKAWLYTIARNRCLSILRARREHASEDIEITIDRLSDDVQNRADLQALVADLGELPDDQREALVLSEVGDLSHAEVAQIIGCEVSKVKSLVFQARTALIERRQARDTSCTEIREQLATLRGGALRRSYLRHHLKTCPGCAQYREDVKRQRQMLAIALPVVPSLGLRHSILAAVGGGGGAAAGSAGIGGGLSIAAKSGLAKSALAKVGIAALVATAGTGTALVATNHVPSLGGSNDSASQSGGGGGGAQGSGGSGGGSPAAGAPGTSTHDVTGTSTKSHSRSASGTKHGFTPTKGQSNGDAANAFALTRGKGKHTGILKRGTRHSHRKGKAHRRRRHRHVAVNVTPVRRRPRAHTEPKAPTRTTTTTPTSTSTTPTTTSTTPTTTSPVHGGGGGGGKGGVAPLKTH